MAGIKLQYSRAEESCLPTVNYRLVSKWLDDYVIRADVTLSVVDWDCFRAIILGTWPITDFPHHLWIPWLCNFAPPIPWWPSGLSSSSGRYRDDGASTSGWIDSLDEASANVAPTRALQSAATPRTTHCWLSPVLCHHFWNLSRQQ